MEPNLYRLSFRGLLPRGVSFSPSTKHDKVLKKLKKKSELLLSDIAFAETSQEVEGH